MTNGKLNAQLYERMSAEQTQYRDWLLGQTAGDVLNHACEDVCYEGRNQNSKYNMTAAH